MVTMVPNGPEIGVVWLILIKGEVYFIVICMAKSVKICNVIWEKDLVDGWRARILGDCESLDDVIEGQRPSRKRYLMKRILRE